MVFLASGNRLLGASLLQLIAIFEGRQWQALFGGLAAARYHGEVAGGDVGGRIAGVFDAHADL